MAPAWQVGISSSLHCCCHAGHISRHKASPPSWLQSQRAQEQGGGALLLAWSQGHAGLQCVTPRPVLYLAAPLTSGPATAGPHVPINLSVLQRTTLKTSALISRAYTPHPASCSVTWRSYGTLASGRVICIYPTAALAGGRRADNERSTHRAPCRDHTTGGVLSGCGQALSDALPAARRHG
jgi:hypothetical protein